MREQLIQYVELLFAATPNSGDIKQEILQNTLDRYDDLVSQGKSPEAAYRLAISGIGDINEILGGEVPRYAPDYHHDVRQAIHEEVDTIQNRRMRAVAVAMYIMCPVPLFILSEFGLDTMGLCFTLLLVAAATVLMILGKKKDSEQDGTGYVTAYTKQSSPKQELRKSISNVTWAISLAVYFILSFTTMAWYITWLIFPICASVNGLIHACLDLKEATEYEK